MKIISVLMLILSIQSCSNANKEGYYKGYETPEYKVEKSFGDIEIRNYKPKLIAKVNVEGNREEAVKKGFRILAKYIFGKNIGKQKLAMTSPVIQEQKPEKISMTSPVTQISRNDWQDNWQVQFTMPSRYSLETLPIPKDDRIEFVIQPAQKIVAIKFSGSWNDKVFNEKKLELMVFLKQQNLQPQSQPIIAYYDDPLTFPWNRRNEIAFEIK